MVAAVLLVGARGLDTGAVETGNLLLFLGYALFLAKPVVRLTRHGARVGKLLASARRICDFLAAAGPLVVPLPAPARGVGLAPGLELPPKGCVMLHGAGAQNAIEVLTGAGAEPAITWDGAPVEPRRLAATVSVVAKRPVWTEPDLADLLASSSAIPTWLEAWGIDRLVRQHAGRSVASSEVSRGEAVGVALAQVAGGSEPLLVLDRPCEALDDVGVHALEAFLAAEAERRLVVVRTTDPGWKLPVATSWEVPA